MSKKKEARQKEEHAALAADIENRLASLKEQFAAAENEKDPAKKIIDLLNLHYTISYLSLPVTDEVNALAEKRSRHMAKSWFKKGGLILASLPLFTLPLTVNSDGYSHKAKAKKEQELREAVDVGGFEKMVRDYDGRVSKMLTDTVMTCDLKEVIKSPYFPEALDNSKRLKKRFEAVAMARAAFGDEQAQNAAAPESAPAAKRGAPSYPELKL